MCRDERLKQGRIQGWRYWAGLGLQSLAHTVALLLIGNGVYQSLFRHDAAAGVFALQQGIVIGLLVAVVKLQARVLRLETAVVRVHVTSEFIPTVANPFAPKPVDRGPN